MRKKLFILPMLLLMAFMANAQLFKDRSNGKITVGFDLYTDINTGSKYENFNLRAINQGFGAYVTYNFPMGETKHTTSLGLGFSAHNFYMKDAWLAEPYNEVITFTEISSYKISKINFNYIDIPLEVNFRIVDKFKISVGAKVSFLVGSKSKCTGDVYDDGHSWEVKYGSINSVESIVYSGFARIGYRCVNLFLGYQFKSPFKDGKGPEILPFSIGIGIRAY